MPFLIALIVQIVAQIVLSALAPKPPKPKPATLDDFSIPTADPTREIPWLFGYNTITGPNVTWYGNLQVKARKKKTGLIGGKQTVGYFYSMGLHFSLAHELDSIQVIKIGDRIAWQGYVLENGVSTIDKPELFGGTEGEGGYEGDLQFLFGLPDQVLDGDALTFLGATPAYRRVFSVIYNGTIGYNVRAPKPFAFGGQRILTGWQDDVTWEPATAPILLGGIPEGPATRITASNQNFKSGGGISVGDQENTRLLNAIGSGASTGSVFLIWFLFERFDSLHLGESVTVYAKLNGTTFWSQTLGWNGGSVYLDARVQLNWPTGSSALTLGFEVSENFYGEWAMNCAYLSSGTVYASVLPEELYLPSTAPEFGRIKDADGNARYAGFYQTAEGTNYNTEIWGIGYDDPGSAVYSMNPAHIAYQLQTTDAPRGMGYPTAIIDDAQYAAAAQTLFDEDLGLCLQWTRSGPIEDFLQEIANHAGAVLRQNMFNGGLFEFKLLRADYDPDTLPLFDESNIIEVPSFQRVGYGETVNEITVVYRDWETNQDASITVQNLANIQAQGSVVSETRQYPGLPTASLAGRIAERDLRAASTPLAKITLKVNRSGYAILPGDCIRVTWAKLGLSATVFRVASVNYGQLLNGVITIEGAEHVFGLSATSYISPQPTTFVDPETAPQPITLYDGFELPLWTIGSVDGMAEALSLGVDVGYAGAFAVAPTSLSLGYNIYSRVSPAAYDEDGDGIFSGSGTLDADITQPDTSITLTGVTDGDQIGAGDVAVIGTGAAAEWVQIAAYDVLTGVATISRGILDTTPADWPAGTRVWVADGTQQFSGTVRATGDSVDVAITSISTGGELAFGFASVVSVVPDQRIARPYPPGAVQINGDSYPATVVIDTIDVTWAHRDRITQGLTIVAQTAPDYGPEAGVTYTVNTYDDATDTLLDTSSGISGTSYSPSIVGVYRLRVEVSAQRDGLDSWQANIRTFDFAGDDGFITSDFPFEALITSDGDLLTAS